MRLSISKKILLIYTILLSFSLVQGLLLHFILGQFRSHNSNSDIVKNFKSNVHALEDIKAESSLYDQHAEDHILFEESYIKAKTSLEKMRGLPPDILQGYSDKLSEASDYLDNYSKAYYELHDLIHSSHQIHFRALKAFSKLGNIMAVLDPKIVSGLSEVFLDHFSSSMSDMHSHDITLLPHLKKIRKKLPEIEKGADVTGILQETIDVYEANYLNFLAIRDRQTFLEDSAAHLTRFCDEVVAALTTRLDAFQERLQWIMTALVAAALLLTIVLFWVSRNYFKRFLITQQDAINNIESGVYDYQLQNVPADEMGDLAIFMHKMASTLKKNEAELRSNERQVRLLLNSAAEAIYGLDVEGKCTFCNNSFLQRTGFESEKELLGKNIHDIIHHTKPDGSDYPADECIAHRGFLEGRPTHSDNEMFFRKDGSSFPAECWSHPIMQDGKVTGAVVTFLDISRRIEALQALRNSEELYRSLVENIELGITLIDKDHSVIMANKAIGKLLNRAPESVQGKKCFREFEKRDEICSHCPGVAAMKSGRVEETFTQGIRDDGSIVSVKVKAFPIFKTGDEPFGFIELVEDISEKMQAEIDLAAEKEQLAVTLRSIGDGVITTDIDGRVVLVNKVAERLCGWRQQEARGRPLSEIFNITNEITGEPCENPASKVLATGMGMSIGSHTILTSRDGRQHPIADSAAAILDRESNIIGVVLVFRDISEEKIREKEMIKSQKLESIGVLAGGIAHDFNNILSAILGNINLVRHLISPAEEKTHAFLEEAEKASIRAKNLTHQLLTFSKGGEPLRKAASIADIIRDSTTFILRGTDIKCDIDIATDIWPVDVDPGQISQVIQNIVLNARHAMPRGGMLLVRCSNVGPDMGKPVTLEKQARYIKIIIADIGIGIPANVIDSIFDPYFTTKKEGSGLGLSICHSIITKHHGHISVESEQGRGTEFTIYLPAAETEIKEGEAEHHEELLSKENLTILIMDDDIQIRDLAGAMLNHFGCTTILASDGEEAVELYSQALAGEKPVDLAIMDLTVPGGMGGKEALDAILKIDPEARVIVSSGYSTDPIMADYRKYGFCAAVVKPYQLKELAAAIEEALKK